jgi:hypothetical protein
LSALEAAAVLELVLLILLVPLTLVKKENSLGTVKGRFFMTTVFILGDWSERDASKELSGADS